MSSSAAIASLPTGVIAGFAPCVPALLALSPENWTAFGSTIAAVLLTMWGREKEHSLARRGFAFVSAIFGGWSVPSIVVHNIPTEWRPYVPTDFPQFWAFSGALTGVISASFFLLLFWAAESSQRRLRTKIDKTLTVTLGADPVPITDLGTPEQQAEQDARLKAKASLRRSRTLE